MTKAGPRGPLKQARLGTVQKQVLIMLIGVRMQRQRLGEPVTGLAYKDIHARLYSQAFIGDSQWLQAVHAQLQREQGKLRAANQLLLDGIDLAAATLRGDWQSHRWTQTSVSFENPLLMATLMDEISQIENTASLLRHAGAGTDQDMLYTTVLGVARQIASFATPASLNYQGDDRFLTLNEAEKTAALKIVNVQRASLSRALRGLSEHELVAQEMVFINQLMNRERRYSITGHGEERLQEEVQKAKVGLHFALSQS